MLPNPVGHASNTELQSFSTALNQREHQKQAKPAKAKLTFSGVFKGGHIYPIPGKLSTMILSGGFARTTTAICGRKPWCIPTHTLTHTSNHNHTHNHKNTQERSKPL